VDIVFSKWNTLVSYLEEVYTTLRQFVNPAEIEPAYASVGF
jgi:hypothetical protein